MDESRLVRDLLDANLQLTGQFLELARLCIGAPTTEVRKESTYVEQPAPTQEFHFSSDTDWDDIPEAPLPGSVQSLEIPRRPDTAPDVPDHLPLHMSEEEEDMRYRVAMQLEPPQALTDLLKVMNLPGDELHFDMA